MARRYSSLAKFWGERKNCLGKILSGGKSEFSINHGKIWCVYTLICQQSILIQSLKKTVFALKQFINQILFLNTSTQYRIQNKKLTMSTSNFFLIQVYINWTEIFHNKVQI